MRQPKVHLAGDRNAGVKTSRVAGLPDGWRPDKRAESRLSDLVHAALLMT